MRKIDQDGLGVRFEAARQNLFEWYEATTGIENCIGVRSKIDPEYGLYWLDDAVQAYYEACLYYEHRSIWSIVYERFVRRVLFVKARIRGLLR